MAGGRTRQGKPDKKPTDNGVAQEEPSKPRLHNGIIQRGKSGKKWTLVYREPKDEDGKRRPRWVTFEGSQKEARAALDKIRVTINEGQYVPPANRLLTSFLDDFERDYVSLLRATTRRSYKNIIKNHLKPTLGHIQLKDLTPLKIQGYVTKALTEEVHNKKAEKVLEGGSPRKAAASKKGAAAKSDALPARDTTKEKKPRVLARKTVLNHLNVLSAALRFAVDMGILSRNPVKSVSLPRAKSRARGSSPGSQGRRSDPTKPKPRILTWKEVRVIINAARNSKLLLPILIAAHTGMRRGEVLALMWEDIDLDELTIFVRQNLERSDTNELEFGDPKTEAGERTVEIDTLLADELGRWKAEQAEQRSVLGRTDTGGLVFDRPDGRPWEPDNFTRDFAKFIKKNDLPETTYHGLRHAHATHLLRSSVYVNVVAQRLGHADIRVTLAIYGHVLPRDQQSAVRVIDRSNGRPDSGRNRAEEPDLDSVLNADE